MLEKTYKQLNLLTCYQKNALSLLRQSPQKMFVSAPQQFPFDERQTPRLGNRDKFTALLFSRLKGRIDTGASGE